MEREFFTLIRRTLRTLGKRRRRRRFAYTDAAIVEVCCWAVINDRPVIRACDPWHWPKGLRRSGLPSQSVDSRRLRSGPVQKLLDRLEHRVCRRFRVPTLAYAIDGKPMPIAGHSMDKPAGYGCAAGGKAKGYKLHALIDLSGTVWSWRVAPMNAVERTVGPMLLPAVPTGGYLLADKNDDSKKVLAAARTHDLPAIIPRRYGPDKEMGHRRHDPARWRCRDLLENTVSGFGRELHRQRKRIEYFFGRLSSGAGSLTCLPS